MKKTILRRIRQKAHRLLKEQQGVKNNILLKPIKKPSDLDNVSYIPKPPNLNQPYPLGNGSAVSCVNDQPAFSLFWVECEDGGELGPQCTCEQFEVTSAWIQCDNTDTWTDSMYFAPDMYYDASQGNSIFALAAAGTGNNFANYKQALLENTFVFNNYNPSWIEQGIQNFQNGPGDIPVVGGGQGFFSEECPGCMITQPQPLSGNNMDIAYQLNELPNNLSMFQDGSCVFEWCNTPEADNYFCNSTLADETIEGFDITFSEWCTPNKDGILVLDPAIGIVEESDLVECYVGGCTDDGNLTTEVWAQFYAGQSQNLGADGVGVLPDEYPGMPGADNYDNLATQDDGSCLYDLDEDGVWSFDETEGCTDSSAFNYNDTATEDDGTCVPIIYGCTDPLAFNFDTNANTDCTDPTNQVNIDADGNETECIECIENLGGCTDDGALNYDSTATFDDDSCCWVGGCIDTNACNYSEDACVDDGSCEYDSCLGCTIAGFNGDAGGNGAYSAANSTTLSIPTVDYCVYSGCLDSSQNEDGSYLYENYVCNGDYAQFLCTSIDIDEVEGVDVGVPLSQESIDLYGLDMTPIGIFIDKGTCQLAPVLGCTNPDAENFNPDATEDDGSCDFIQGCMENTTADWSLEDGGYVVSNYQPDATQNFGCNYVVCLDPNAENYVCDTDDGLPYLCLQNTGNPNEDLDDDFIDTIGATIEDCTYDDQNIFDAAGTNTCCFNIIPGCMQGGSTITNPQGLTADNYDPNANVECTNPDMQEDNDTGLPCEPCVFTGCADPEACNSIVGDGQISIIGFGAWVYNDDGSCEYPDTCNDCDGNYLTDGCTDEQACNFDPSAQCGPNDELCDYGCYGCTDSAALNFDQTATMDDGSCEYDEMCWDITITQCNSSYLNFAYQIAETEGTRSPGGPAMWTNVTLRCVSIGYPSAAEEIGPNDDDGIFGGNPPFVDGTSPNGLGEYVVYEGFTAEMEGGPGDDLGIPYVPAAVCPTDALPLGNSLYDFSWNQFDPNNYGNIGQGGCCVYALVHVDSAGHPNVYTNAGTLSAGVNFGELVPNQTGLSQAAAVCNNESPCATNVGPNSNYYCNGVSTTTIDFNDDGSGPPDDDIIYNPPIDEGLINEQADIPTGLGALVDYGEPYRDVQWGSDTNAIWRVTSVSEPYSATGEIIYLPTSTDDECYEYSMNGPFMQDGQPRITNTSNKYTNPNRFDKNPIGKDAQRAVNESKKLRKSLKSLFKK